MIIYINIYFCINDLSITFRSLKNEKSNFNSQLLLLFVPFC